MLPRSPESCRHCDGSVEGITPTSVGVQRILEVSITLERDFLKVVSYLDV